MAHTGPGRDGPGSAEEAEALWRLHLQEAENYLLANKSMTTVLDLLG